MTRHWFNAFAAASILASSAIAAASPRYGQSDHGRAVVTNRPSASYRAHGFNAPRAYSTPAVARPAFTRPIVTRPAFTRPAHVRTFVGQAPARVHVRPEFVRPYVTRPYVRPYVVHAPVRPYLFTAHHHGFFDRIRALRLSALRFGHPHHFTIAERQAELARLEAELAAIQSGASWVTTYAEYAQLVTAIDQLRASLGVYAPAPTVAYTTTY